MRTIYFLFTALLFTISACDGIADVPIQQSKLVGFWKLIRITGGFSGQGYPADFTNVEFKNNNTYRVNNQDEAKGEGTYTLTTTGDKLTLTLTPNDATKIGFEEYEKDVVFDGAQLFLNDPCCDLFSYEFGKETGDD